MTPADWTAVRLTAQLAGLTTVLLLLLGTAAGLVAGAHTLGLEAAVRLAGGHAAGAAALGAGLLPAAADGTAGPVGQLTQSLGLGRLPFTFSGLVIASVLYSMPFVVQPLQQAFEAIPPRTLEAAATLRAGPLDRFFSVALPLARPGLLTASVLGFAHTVGEFGVVLMIGGNIPGATRVLSVAIYDHVEAAEFADAHRLAAGMVVFALVVLVTLYVVNRPRGEAVELPR